MLAKAASSEVAPRGGDDEEAVESDSLLSCQLSLPPSTQITHLRWLECPLIGLPPPNPETLSSPRLCSGDEEELAECLFFRLNSPASFPDLFTGNPSMPVTADPEGAGKPARFTVEEEAVVPAKGAPRSTEGGCEAVCRVSRAGEGEKGRDWYCAFDALFDIVAGISSSDVSSGEGLGI